MRGIRNTIASFWENIEKTEGCWNWKGAQNSKHYGYFSMSMKHKMVHRWSYEFAFGRIPEGMKVCHKCDNPLCVRPAHPFLGTQRDNMLDMIKKGRNAHHHLLRRRKLSHEDVRRIRVSDKADKDLAQKYGVTRSVIYKIRHNQIWKSLPSLVSSMNKISEKEESRT